MRLVSSPLSICESLSGLNSAEVSVHAQTKTFKSCTPDIVAAVSIFPGTGLCTGRIDLRADKTGFGFGMDFIWNIIMGMVRCGRF